MITGRLHITPNTKVGLDKHMMLHMSIKSLSFKQFENTFKHKVALQQHMRTHTGEGPYIYVNIVRKHLQSAHH